MKNTFGHVLVTGGAGFIGSRLLRKLLPISQSVTVIDDCSTSRRENLPVSERLTFIEASYVDEQLLERVLPRTTHIYHLACRNLVKSAQNMDDDLHVNLYGGYLLLKKSEGSLPALAAFRVYVDSIGLRECRRSSNTRELLPDVGSLCSQQIFHGALLSSFSPYVSNAHIGSPVV